jgi:hypothetical protein
MTDTNDAPQAEGERSESEAWKEVGSQFKELGESLAAAFQAAWQSEEVRNQAEAMKTGLETMMKQVGRAIDETVSSPGVQHATSETVKATEQAAREARPHVLKALRQVNAELQLIIGRLEERDAAAKAGAPPPEE